MNDGYQTILGLVWCLGKELIVDIIFSWYWTSFFSGTFRPWEVKAPKLLRVCKAYNWDAKEASGEEGLFLGFALTVGDALRYTWVCRYRYEHARVLHVLLDQSLVRSVTFFFCITKSPWISVKVLSDHPWYMRLYSWSPLQRSSQLSVVHITLVLLKSKVSKEKHLPWYHLKVEIRKYKINSSIFIWDIYYFYRMNSSSDIPFSII